MIKFRAPASELELNFALPAQVEVGAFVSIFSFTSFTLRDVEASCRLLTAWEIELFAGRLALHSPAILRRKKKAIIHPVLLVTVCIIQLKRTKTSCRHSLLLIMVLALLN